MPTFPAKTNYAAGDVLTAAQMVDVGNGLNDLLPDAKGSLTTVSAANTPAQLTVGANGTTLVADSSASTGLRWQGNFAAGKNKIINGDFGIWQRGTSFTVAPNANTYVADRFQSWHNGTGNCTISRQAFTAGQTDVPGNPLYFIRTTGGTGTNYTSDIFQNIEDVNTFAGQAVTISFYAKASSTQSLQLFLTQNFGSGGSANVDNFVTLNSSTLGTSWARYTGTITLASISGKTIGAGSYLNFRIRNNNTTSNGTTWDVANVQIEAGSVATAFQTATGTLAGELAACMRYYYRTDNSQVYSRCGIGIAQSSTILILQSQLPVRMRVTPTAVEFASIGVNSPGVFTNAVTAVTLTTTSCSRDFTETQLTTTGLTTGNAYFVMNNNTTAGYIAYSAEL